MDAPKTVSRLILDIISEFALNKFDDASDRLAAGTPSFLAIIDTFVATQQEVQTCLPSFPFKSANKKYKVLGSLPDKAEELALNRLNTMCQRICDIYPPGARVTIVSDGMVYNDLVAVPDRETWRYGEALRKMAHDKAFSHISFARIKDLIDCDLPEQLREITYVANCTNIRRILLNTYGKDDLDIDKEIANNQDTKLTYLGYRRFLESDLKEMYPLDKDRSNLAYKRDVKYLAKQILKRGYAFAGAVKNAFPNYLRLSIHESIGEHKVSISLLNTQTGFTTPWHCSVAQLATGEWISAPMGEFQNDSRLELVYEDGNPSYFKEKPRDDSSAPAISESWATFMPAKKISPASNGSSTPSSLSDAGSSTHRDSSASPPPQLKTSGYTTPSLSSNASEMQDGNATKNLVLGASSPSRDYGKRLLPQIIDGLAVSHPDQIIFSLSSIEKKILTLQDVTIGQFAKAIDKTAWWLEKTIGKQDRIQPIAYIGPLYDLRHILFTYACVKIGSAALFLSPKNSTHGALAVLEALNCNIWARAGDAATIPLVEEVLSQRPMTVLNLPPLDSLLDANSTPDYPYTKTFEQVSTDPFCFLHTSGSTGIPKPIPWSHALIGTLDAVRLLPPVDGLLPWTTDWKPKDRLYSSFPMSHGAGILMDILMPPLFNLHCIIGPADILPNITLIKLLAEQACIDIWSLVPSLVDEVGETPDVLAKLAPSKFICASGGPVSLTSAGKANQVIRVLNLTGTTEGLFIGNLVVPREDWSWFAFHPYSGFEFKQIDEDTYEHWIHYNPQHASLFQGIYHTFPEKQSINFKDLYTQHPTKPGLWAFKGRNDDLVVLSNGYKISPLQIEAFISTHPAVSGCLVIGTGKPQPALLIELKDPNSKGAEELFESVWEMVQKSSLQSQNKNQFLRDFIAFADADKPFSRTDKGTVKRSATLKLYEDYIERFYRSRNGSIPDLNMDMGSLESIQNNVRQLFASHIPEIHDLNQDDNILELGFDSIAVFVAIKTLRVATGLRDRLNARGLYANPTVGAFSSFLFELASKVGNDASSLEGSGTPKTKQSIAQHQAWQWLKLNTGENIPRSAPGHEILREIVRTLWAEVLNSDSDSFEDDDIFFEVGGDSIRAQQLIAAAKKQGLSLTMENIFLNVSLEEMSKAIQVSTYETDGAGEEESAINPFSLLKTGNKSREETLAAIATKLNLSQQHIENAYPCSPMQESLLSELEGSSNLYVRQFVFHFNQDLVVDRLRHAWDETIAANPILRTRICYLNKSVGYTQAVMNETYEWEVKTGALADFLAADAGTQMLTGAKFFRYTVIIDQDDKVEQRHFVWTVHHALCDGISVIEVLDEVARRLKGVAVEPRQPFDAFIKSAILDVDASQEQKFWKQIFEDQNPTPYPVLPQTPQFQASPSKVHQSILKMNPKNHSLGLTNALLLRATWAILLSYYTGTLDVVFGTINNGRSFSIPGGVASMIGPAISLAPISLKVDPQETIKSFLSAVRVQYAEMMRFEHTGISKMRYYLADELSTIMDFQTMLVIDPQPFEEAIAASMQTIGLQYNDSLGKREEHPNPLVLTCTIDNETDILLTVQYDDRVLAKSQVENLAHHFQALLTCLTHASPDALLGSLSPLSENDTMQIKKWNSFTPLTEEICVHNLFQRQVQEHPNAIAVCTVDQSFTYMEVDNFSSALATQLIHTGVIPGQYVGVCFEKSIWTVVAILAVFKSGAVYVPIEPDHPESRIKEVIIAAGIEAVLASPHGATVLAGLCEKVITVEKAPVRVDIDLPTVSPSSTAYLLFTSGSTGKPKGILMPHSGICTSIIHHGRAFGASPNWRTLQFGAHTFDLSIAEFFTTLAFGGCICVPSQAERLNNLAGAITALKANTLMVVPTVANLLFPSDVPMLKTIILAGEPITKETIMRWADHVDLTTAYGPSETAVYCSGSVKVSANAHPAHIGPAIGGTMWITSPDNHHELAAIGCVGEIVISGGLLGGGYFGDEAGTDAAFVPTPQWMRELDPESPFDKIYRSGDLAKYNADGTMHIVGRRDTQVKLRGFRIELGEIENQVMASRLVAAAISILPANGPCTKQIVVVLSLHKSVLVGDRANAIALSEDRHSPQTTGTIDRLRDRLSALLPDYMMPTVWVVLESMPLLISGKVDRKAIKQWVDSMEDPTFQGLVEPQSTTGDSGILPGSVAHSLRNLWSDVLTVPADQLGLRTSFFAVGGDSIAAIQIVARARQLGLAAVTVQGIIGAKTLGNLAKLVEQSTGDAALQSPSSLAGIKRKSTAEILEPYQDILKKKLQGTPSVTVLDAYELAPFQRELLRQRKLNPAVFVLSWHMEVASRTEQPISLSKLVRAWERVVQKFPILHSVFLADGTLEPIQVVLGNAKPEISTFSLPLGQADLTFETLGVTALDECFLPHRALFSQRGGRFFIHIELDHLVFDGWSLKLIKAALLTAYEADDAYTLEEKEVPTYKSFVEAHQQQDRAEEDLRYWTDILRDQQSSLLSLPPSPYLSNLPLSSKKTVFYLPDIPAKALTDFGVANGITPASVIDAAWAQTLSAFLGSSNIGFEYVISGRDEDVPGVFEIVGPLINVLAYHLQDVSAAKSVEGLASLARRMQGQRAQDGLHSSINIRTVAEAVKQEPLFNTGVNFQKRPTTVRAETLSVDDDIEKSSDPWHFGILVRVIHMIDDNALRPSFEFDARRFDAQRMTKVAEDFWQRLEQITAVPEQ